MLPPDTDELARFRVEWQAELQQRAQIKSSFNRPEETQVIKPPVEVKPLQSAVEIYGQAVLLEQQGELHHALKLYSKAFRIDPQVDKAYNNKQFRIQSVQNPVQNQQVKNLGTASTYNPPDSSDSPLVFKALLDIISCWSPLTEFFPDEEGQPTCLSILPDELLVSILRCLDYLSVERFGTTSKKARLVTLDPGLWKSFAELVYVPPQIPKGLPISYLAERYGGDNRRLFIEHPRIRSDGVYIAVCHYVRRGLGENAWVNVNHLITYHRYIRFFRNGVVVSLLVNDTVDHQKVVPSIGPDTTGAMTGQWVLSGNTVIVDHLVKVCSGEPPGRHQFRMVLQLKSRPLGRWNRLSFINYESVSIESGEAEPLPLRHERPFWFSKVRSFSED